MKGRRSKAQRLLNAACDSVVEAVSPSKALRRQVVRKHGRRLANLASAEMTRFNAGWRGVRDDGNAQVLPDLPEVRGRARDASVNNPVYIAVRETMTQHVVGSQGIQPRSSIDHERLGITRAQADEWQQAVNEFWAETSPHADVTGRQIGWGNFLRLVYRSMFDGGDVFPTLPLRVWPGLGQQTRVNLIEAERVDTPPNRRNDERVRGGVRMNAWGQPVGYYVSEAHPGDRLARGRALRFRLWNSQVRGRVNILHLHQQERVGLTRGLPRLGPVLNLIEQVEEYRDTTLVAAEMQTRFAMFIKTAGDPDLMAEMLTGGGDGDSAAYADQFGDGSIEPGSINILNTGDDVTMAGASHPSAYFDPFVVRMLRTISSVTKVPYSIAFGDTQGANYSSMRREFQSFRHTVACEQDLLMPLCRTYWQQLIYEGWLARRILPDADWVDFRERPLLWASALWSMPVLGNVDPTKETKSDIDSIQAGIVSAQEVIRSRGGDPEKVLRERREWLDAEKREGLTTSPVDTGPGEQELEIDENTELPPQLQQGDDE